MEPSPDLPHQADRSFSGRLVESAPDGLVVVDDAGTIVEFNERAQALFGYARDEVLGKSVESLLPDRLREAHRHHQQAYLHDPDPRRMSERPGLRGLRRDGSEFEVEVSLNTLEVDGRRLVIAAVRDASDWMQAGIERDGVRFQLEMERSPIVLGTVDRDLRYTWLYNPHPHFPLEEALGKRDDELTGAEGAEELMALKRHVMETGESVEQTIEFDLGDEVRSYDIFAAPVKDQHGTVVGVNTAAVDVTRLRRLLTFQREFVAMIAHDLRNPLTIIRGSAQQMLRKAAFDEEALREIVEQTRRVSRMVEDLLDTAAIESGHLHLQLSELDLEEIVRDTSRLTSLLSDRHHIVVRTPGRALRGRWDRVRLQQVIENLLGNAIKYSPDGGEIVLAVEDLGDRAEISVCDPGVGLRPEDLDSIFESFGRAASARRGGIGGLGLGLSIARGLVDAHGGRITAASDGPGRGSTFTVTLPYQPPTSAAPAAAAG